MAEPEDVRIENAEDREWERLRDAVEAGVADFEDAPQRRERPRHRPVESDDEGPQFKFIDE